MFIDYSNPDNVVIKHKDSIYHGEIRPSFLNVFVKSNHIVFDILKIPDRYAFVSNIVGYKTGEGDFPDVKCKEDVIKVLDALNKEYEKRFGTTKQFDSEKCLNPEDLKEGDYICVEDGGFKAIYIFKEFIGNKLFKYVYYNCDDNTIDILSTDYFYCGQDTKIRKATSNEMQTLDNALLVKKGLFWNLISKQLEKVESSASVGVLGTISVGVPAITYTACNRKLVCKALEVENTIEHPSTPSETVPDISIKTFIKPKKHYKLNFNN